MIAIVVVVVVFFACAVLELRRPISIVQSVGVLAVMEQSWGQASEGKAKTNTPALNTTNKTETHTRLAALCPRLRG